MFKEDPELAVFVSMMFTLSRRQNAMLGERFVGRRPQSSCMDFTGEAEGGHRCWHAGCDGSGLVFAGGSFRVQVDGV